MIARRGARATEAAAPAMPVTGRDFRVTVADVGPRGKVGRERELPCAEVVLPALRAGGESEPLVLRRAHTGATELVDWLRHERDDPSRVNRAVTVSVLRADGTPLTAWRFSGCHLAALHFSPLDALAATLFTETAEITFTNLDQLAP